MMLTAVCLAFLGVGAQAYDLDSEVAEADPRLFFVNFTSSLVQVNSTILTYGLLALGIAGAAALALYYLYIESANSSSYGYGQSYGSNYGYQQYARYVRGVWREFYL